MVAGLILRVFVPSREPIHRLNLAPPSQFPHAKPQRREEEWSEPRIRFKSLGVSGRVANQESPASRRPIKKKRENTVIVTPERLAAARAWMTPERLAAFDAMTDEDIAAQIASNPDAAPELDDAWFERARLVIPLKGRKAA